jgi:sarcosine oxidase delta subunit
MLRIACPHCGTRDHTEFTDGGDATVKLLAADGSRDDWYEAVYLRGNRAVCTRSSGSTPSAGPGSSCTAIP